MNPLFMILLAAFSILLQRYSGQDDIIIGSPIANRRNTETEGLIGCFLNTIPLRLNLEDNPRFCDFLKEVRRTCLEAYEHQDIPFEKLVEVLQPRRDLHRHPIFDVMINLVNTPDVNGDLPGLKITRLDREEQEAKFYITLYIRKEQDSLRLELAYRADLFSSKRMKNLLDQFAFLLTNITRAPDTVIHAYSLVTPSVANALPDPSQPIPEPAYILVPDQFMSFVNTSPANLAVTRGAQQWTYRELGERARLISSLLYGNGFQQGDAVAIYGQRSVGLIASMVGVLISGGIMVPIDQNLPESRKRLLCEVARPKWLLYVGESLSNDSWIAETPLFHTFMIVNSETGKPIDNTSAQCTLPSIRPGDPAYIFFTSGTTGTPRGVLGSHKGLAHFLTWQRDTFGVSTGDRVAQLTNLSFDVVLREIFLPFYSGATLCIPGDERDLTPNYIMNWMERERITILHVVPSLARFWLSSHSSNVPLAALRCIFFAGEPLPHSLVERWSKEFPASGEIVNLYGPTETTLAKCFYRVSSSEETCKTFPVGRPLPQTQALVLNRRNLLCGPGEPGEVVIRTPFRSLGYYHNEIETNLRFAINPFRDDRNDLLYYTGDRGVYTADGNLEILGRLDDQVKIRGMRFELGEVQAAIAAYPSVEDAVVMVEKSDEADDRLIAYVLPSRESTTGFSLENLRAYLRAKLPNHMVPSSFVVVESIPLTANGKVDRRKLLEFKAPTQEFIHEYYGPRNEIESIIAEIWIEALECKKVSIRENFFDLGGHSLLLLQVREKLNARLNVLIPVVDMFQYSTIETLAEYLKGNVDDGAYTRTESMNRAEKRRNELERQRLMRRSRSARN